MLVAVRIGTPLGFGYVDDTAASIDTRRMWTTIPSKFALPLVLRDLHPARDFAAQGVEGLRESVARIEMGGRSIVSSVLVSDRIDHVVIGLANLTSLCFRYDAVEDRLIETELLLK